MLLTHAFMHYFIFLIVVERNWLGNEKWVLYIRMVPVSMSEYAHFTNM